MSNTFTMQKKTQIINAICRFLSSTNLTPSIWLSNVIHTEFHLTSDAWKQKKIENPVLRLTFTAFEFKFDLIRPIVVSTFDAFLSVLLNFLYRINSENAKFADANKKNEKRMKHVLYFIFS